MASPPRPARGFTLVEVLVALLVMAVLAGMAWRGMDAIVRSRDITQARMEQTLRINTVLAQWEQDLQAVQDNPQVPALSFDGATLRLVRRTDTGVQIVAWSVRDGHWLRWTGPSVTRVAPLQESWLRSQQLLGNEPGQLRTLDGVTGWQVYFYRGNGWSNAQSSGDVAPTPPPGLPVPIAAQRQALATGVRLVMKLEGGTNGSLVRDVMLAPQMP